MGQQPAAVWQDLSGGRHGRHARARTPRRARWPLALLAAAFAGGTVAMAVLGTAGRDTGSAISVAGLTGFLDRLAGELGLGLDQIEISGHRLTADRDILDAIDLRNVHSYLTFDTAATRTRIERLAWVETATIEPRLPNRLGVRILERQPFAVWERGTHDVLVDTDGRQLATVGRGHSPQLPRIAGVQAPEDAHRLLTLVASYPDIARRLGRAERIAGRRWRLIMQDDSRIELPADADAAALAMLVEPKPEGRLIDVAAAVIDLTILRRITLRPLPAAKRP